MAKKRSESDQYYGRYSYFKVLQDGCNFSAILHQIFFKIDRRQDIDLEGFHEIDLRSFEGFQRDNKIAISRNLVFSRDLVRFHNSEVLRLSPLRFQAFWQKNEVNRTNIKDHRAILRFFKMAAIFQPSLIGPLPKSNQLIYS